MEWLEYKHSSHFFVYRYFREKGEKEMANEGRRIPVTLDFKSDTTQMNKDLDRLEQKLRSIGQGQGILGGDQAVTKEMNTAMNAASKLSSILQKCRLDNGKLNVASFKRELENAGYTAQSLATELAALGPTGVQAFNNISKAVMNSEVSVRKTQGMMAELALTLKNTAKWQISSSLLHGFMSSVSHAYNYAQDLNSSLNNIRIITKQNADEMANFAKQANEAAKGLSVSTTAYTDAALIFYQQGLKGEDVTSRTDVVAKMSNVTKDSVADVSSYMTAIWNNFDDGSQSLEHYADVITGLGAATAASSAEIAQGLEKFAAVADTVGLSYDYATSALATVVAQTRQSADTVGTAFKTLFARIEGLKLGETLDDGVDLNKYSAALQKVGVDILTANGQLKDMDTILDEVGARWKTLGKEQQVALAQTVAGTRQYNQLIALLDNWDKVQENLTVARGSEGELQAQADVYAKSWEAAKKRVETAAQVIYKNLMDEDFFIKLANGAEKLLTFIGKIVESLGGLKGMWPMFAMGITKLFSGDIGINIGNQIAGFKESIEQAAGVFQQFKDSFGEASVKIYARLDERSMADAMAEYQKFMQEISQVREGVDKNDTATLNLLNDMVARFGVQIQALAEARTKLTELESGQENAIIEGATDSQVAAIEDLAQAEQNLVEQRAETAEKTQQAEKEKVEATTETTQIIEESETQIETATQKSAEAVETASEKIKEGFQEAGKAAEEAADKVNDAASTIEKTLQGKKFAIHGKSQGFTQEELEADIKSRGGTVTRKAEKADYLISGEGRGTVKLNAAQENNVPIINIEQYKEIAGIQTEIKENAEEINKIEQQRNEIANQTATTEKEKVETEQIIKQSVDEANQSKAQSAEFTEQEIEALKQGMTLTDEEIQAIHQEAELEEEKLKNEEKEKEIQDEKTAKLQEQIQKLEQYIARYEELLQKIRDASNPTAGAIFNALGGDAAPQDIQRSLKEASAIYKERGDSLDVMDPSNIDPSLVNNLKNAFAIPDESVEKVNAIKASVSDIMTAQGTLTDEVNTTVTELSEGAITVEDIEGHAAATSEAMGEVAKKSVDVKENSQATSEALDQIQTKTQATVDPAKQFADNFSKNAMNAARFATVLTQVDNLIDQMSTKDPGEWAKSLVAILPMIIFNLKASWGFIQSIHSGLTAILSGEVKQSIVKAVNLKLTQKQAAAQAQIAKDKAVETANDVAQSGAKAAGNAAGTAGAGAGAAGATAGAAAAGEGAGTGGMLAALGGSAAAVAASVVLIVGALAGVAAYIVHKVNMQNLKKEAEKAAAKETKQAEKIEEVTAELDAIDQLAEGYDNLKANMDSMTREQAKAQAIQLAAQYEDESLMILALTESYAELEAQIRKTQAARQEEAGKELETGIEYNKDNILAQAQKAAGSAKDAGGDKWDLGHGEGEYTRIAIENLLGKQNYQFEAGTKMLKEDWESMWEKATTDPEAFKKFQQEVVDAAARGENAAIHLKEYIDAASESIKAAADNVNKLKQLKLETAFNEIYNGLKGAINGADDFFNFVEQVKAKDSEASDSDVIHMASTYANTQDSAVYGETALSVADQQGWDLEIAEDKEKFDNLVEDLKKYDKDTVAVLGVQVNVTGSIVDENGHINLKESGMTEDQLRTLGGVQHEKSEINKIQGAMSKFDPTKAAKGNAWSKKDRAEMGDIEGLNLNASDEDILEQLRKLEQDHIKTLEDKKKAADELTESMAKLADSEEIRYHNLEGYGKVDLKNETEESMQQKANIAIQHQSLGNTTVEDFSADFSPKEMITSELTGDDLKQSLEEAEEQGKSLRDELVLISEYYADKLPDNAKEFDEQIKKVYADLNIEEEENKELIKNSIKLRKDATNAIKKYNQQTKVSEDVIAALNSEVEAQGDSLETLQNRVIAASQSMDNMQSAYKSLKGVEAQYAEDHFLTVDSFQEILNLEPQYLSALEFENGQLKVNEGTLQEVAIARVRNMEAEQAELMMKELDIIATRGEDDEERRHLLTKYASIAANEVAGFTMEAVAAKAKQLAAANSELAATYNNVAAAARNYAAAADATVKGLQTNFPKAMGYSPKGGGGSKKKEKEKKDLKEYADEFDRFYPFQKVIDDLADAMSDLAKAQDHMAGGELVGALRKQNRLLQEQKKAYQELAKEQKKYQKEMQADLAKYGMSFNVASGNIANYAEATQKMLDTYNAAIEKYNKSAQEDADKKALEAVEKEYEKFKSLVSNYQGILTEIQDTENELDDIYYETIANNLKEFEIMVQVKLDIGEARRMVNDFISKINKNFKTLRKSTEEWMDVFDTALKNAHTYVDGELGTVNVDMEALNKVKAAIDSGDYGNEGSMFASRTEAITKYKELAEQLKEDANELYELYKQAWEDYIDAIDESIEAWEEIIDNFDDINDTLNHYEKVIELLHDHQDTDQGYEELIALYNRQMQLQLAKQETLKKQIETMQEEYDQLIAQGAKENDKDVKAIKDAINNANKELMGSIEDYLETINKAFNKQMEKATSDYIKNAFGFDPEEYTEAWARSRKEMEGYYDANERILQIDKIRRKYNDAINKTTDLKTQQKLAQLRDEEIKDLESMDKLAEKRVTLSEKKLALAQAEAALEEAQNNKSQMRLQRDSQGNWNYQFVANEDDISEKEQNVADAAYEQYEVAKEWTQKLYGEDIPALVQECQDKINEIWADGTLTREQKEQKIKETVEYYQNLIQQKVAETNLARTELGEATATALITADNLHDENFSLMNEKQQRLVEELRDKGITSAIDVMTATKEEYDEIVAKANESNAEVINSWDLLEQAIVINNEQMTAAAQNYYNEVKRLNDEYDEAVRRSEEASGIAWSNVMEAIQNTGMAIDEVTNKVEDCIARTQALSDFRERVMEIEQAWQSVKQSIEDALLSLDGYLQELLRVEEMQRVVQNNEVTGAGSYTGPSVSGPSNGGNDGPGSSTTPGETPSRSSTLYRIVKWEPWNHAWKTIKKGFISETLAQSERTRLMRTDEFANADLKVESYTEGSDSSMVAGTGSYKVSASSGIDLDEEKKKIGSGITKSNKHQKYSGHSSGGHRFATGGYTGEWGDDARWALLDQKELVLNAADTKNILDAVQLVRGTNNSDSREYAAYLADAIKESAQQVAQIMEAGIDILSSNLMSAMDYITYSLRDSDSSQLEQNVHIEASFPNVRDRREIEDAFENLVNIASQRSMIGSY